LNWNSWPIKKPPKGIILIRIDVKKLARIAEIEFSGEEIWRAKR